MFCSHRIYKGEDFELPIYMEEENYSDLQIRVYTNGDYYVVPQETSLSGDVITCYFHDDDLDILPDGVIRYELEYEVDGETIIRDIATNLYLKTPDTYSGKTAEEVYEDGYESGYTAGQEECVSAITEAFQSGYTSGYTDGYASGFTSGTTAGEIVNYVFAISGAHQIHGDYEPYRLKINGVEFIHTLRKAMVAGVNYLEFEGWGSLPTKYPQPTTISLRVSKINTDGWSSGGTWEVNNVILNANSVDNGGAVPTLWTNTGFKFYPISYEVEADPENPDYVWITATLGPCDCSSSYESGYTDGYASGYTASLTNIYSFQYFLSGTSGGGISFSLDSLKFDGNNANRGQISMWGSGDVNMYCGNVNYDVNHALPSSFSMDFETEFREGCFPYDFTINGNYTPGGSPTYEGGFPLHISSFNFQPSQANPNYTTLTIYFN